MGEANATLKHFRISPLRAQRACNLVRGKRVEDALSILTFSPQKGARVLHKVISSAVANADNKNLDVDQLYIKEIRADKGAIWYRHLPRAHGRADSIKKLTSHIQVTLAEKD